MRILLLIFFAFGNLFALAQHSGVRFVENKGQWEQPVLFKAGIPGGSCYLENDRFTFNFLDSEQLFRRHQAHSGEPVETPLEDFIRGHAYQVIFKNSQLPVLQTRNPSPDYFNYFLGSDPAKWASFARAYETITLEQIYPLTNLKVYTSGDNVKYDFVIQPGGQSENIELEYQGVDNLKIKKGKLIVSTSVNEIIEAKPFAYQLIDGKIIEIECDYQLSEKTIRFAVGDYDKNLPLIIDPELSFSTYSGSTADNFGFTATFDQEGFLYSGSSIFGNGYPTTLGAYQTSWAGGTGAGSLAGNDIGITKYDTSGTSLVYSTYIGGSSDELPHSLIVNQQGELYLYGTTSSPNYPTTGGAFQEVFNGGSAFAPSGVGVSYVNGSDIVVSKLSAAGTDLLASTFIGGTGNDGLSTGTGLKFNYADEMRGEVLFDNDDNVIIVSSTYSADFPVTSEAFQPTIGGNQDGCIIKLDSDLENVLFGTYLGGLQPDAAYAVDVDSENNVIVTGGTVSTDFPVTAGTISGSFNGGSADGYVTILSPDLSEILHSTYYGTNQYDQLYFVQLDNEDNIYVFGQTRGPTGALIQNAAYNVNNGGMLVAKFEPDLSGIIWSTRFGSGASVNPNLSPAAFLVDVCNKIYLSGWGGQTNVSSNPNAGYTTGLPVTADAYQSTTDGSDFYIMVLEEDASALTYASFFGGNQSNEHVDGGTSRFDRSGKIYQSVCAGCGNNDDFPIWPPNAWSPTNQSNNCNNGVFKFDFGLPITIAQFTAYDVCLPEQVSVNNQSSGAVEYNWYVNGELVSDQSNPALDLDEPGSYTITLSAFNAETCNMTDSATQVVNVYPMLELEPIADVNLCDPDTVFLSANTSGTATSFHWSTQPDFSDQINDSPQDSIIAVFPMETTTYYLLVSNGFCEEEESITVTPAPQAEINLSSVPGCDGDTVSIELTNLTPEISFENITWSPSDAILSGQGTPNLEIITSGSYFLTANVLTENGCLLSDSVFIDTDELILQVSPDTTLCNNSQTATLTATTNGVAQSYVWSENPDFSNPINSDGENTIDVSPEETTTYYIQAQNGNCIRNGEVTVFVVDGSAALSPEFTICLHDTLQIEAVNLIPSVELSYLWSPEEEIISGASTSTITVSPEETTVYEVLITTEDGCSFSQSTIVYVSDLGTGGVFASVDPNTIPAGESAVLNAIPNNPDYLYFWNPTGGLANPYAASTLATPEETTTYTVTIIDQTSGGAGNCQKSASVILKVYDFVCGPPNLFLPNAFTPNGDGNNDVLYLRGDNITNMHLAIYNRWGELVFETNNQSVGWDGTHRGKDVDPAVFVYHLEADCGDGQRFIDKGNVTVIR